VLLYASFLYTLCGFAVPILSVQKFILKRPKNATRKILAIRMDSNARREILSGTFLPLSLLHLTDGTTIAYYLIGEKCWTHSS
jgi:hypothetical protein